MVFSNCAALGTGHKAYYVEKQTYHYFSKALKDVKQVMISSSLLEVSNE